VTGLADADFEAVTTGTLSGVRVTAVTGSGTSYTVTVDTGSGDGTVGLRLKAGGVSDAAGNVNSAYTTPSALGGR
jgi:hypothetical protein